MKSLLAILFAVGCAYAAYYFTLEKSFVNPYPVVCDLVAKKIYLEDEQVKKWSRLCHRRSRLVTPYSQRKMVIRDLNNVLGLLNVSHLEVYDSSAVKSIWRGENLETGIESEFIDSELVIFKIHPGSPAFLAGLKKGDVIKSVDGDHPNPWDAQSLSGIYVIERKNKELTIPLKAARIIRTQQVQFEVMPKGAVIQVPSFRADFFDDKVIANLSEKLKNTKNLIVDLRGNSGGNFVAGLRFLSLVMCEPKEIGKLVRPRFGIINSTTLPNDLNDKKQLEILDAHREVRLKTFAQSSCYRGSIKVLVDGKTASVAEMVAQALKEFKQAKLLGAPSRGQMLVGVWYPLQEVGPGVEISIPEAVYISSQKHRIEGRGVELDKVLYYDLAEMQAGTDSWVRRAQE